MRGRWLAAGALLLAILTGCDTPKVKALSEENQRLNTIVLNYEKENRDLMNQVEEMEARLKKLEIAMAGKDRQMAALRSGMDRLRRNARLSDKVQEQLRRLAETFGGRLVGNRLELPGDFFFGSGEFDLREEAKQSLRKLARILMEVEGEKLTLLIVGHTDSDPVRHSRAKGIRDNRHLSVMRALSVLNELKHNGYPERLMYPTGWGELFPLDTGTTMEAKAVNRRVDILIDPAASGLFGVSEIVGVEAAAVEEAPSAVSVEENGAEGPVIKE